MDIFWNHRLHECSVEQLFNKMSFDRQILLAIQFIESLNVCLGFPLKESERVVTIVPHRTDVLESMTDGLQGKKVCAQNCLVLTSSPSNTCQNCFASAESERRTAKPSVPIAINRALPIDETNDRKINRSIDDNRCQLID